MTYFVDIDDYKKLNHKEIIIKGKVVHGNKIGRLIEFPTANIMSTHFDILPISGVYAVKVIHKSQHYFGMMNLGTKPTLDDSSLSLEVHIFDFIYDIYGDEVEIVFFKRIRDQKKFQSLDELKNQLQIDKYNVLLYLDSIK